ncbi:MAG: tRNA pseudouridine(55) synthase TruB [Clostridia bacterium]|nr:tRNA pseudouridine(55) synthase TruB [Clostridia bacterium]
MKNKGIILINKPAGWTSFDVVNKIKHMVKPLKVGHLGTLDPMATGVLMVTIGKATKLFDLMQEKTKTYLATFEFGYETDTLDSTGQITDKTDIIPNIEDIKQIMPYFIGEYDQIPPKYSAKSIDGKRAYDMARQGIEFELKSKKVKIHNLEIINFKNNVLKIQIKCGSGTYIRSVGRDIAYKLNSLATMTSLVRESVDKFTLKDCHNIEEIDKNNIFDKLLTVDELLGYTTLNLDDINLSKILNGQTLFIDMPDGTYKINAQSDTVALVKITNFKAKMSLFLG